MQNGYKHTSKTLWCKNKAVGKSCNTTLYERKDESKKKIEQI